MSSHKIEKEVWIKGNPGPLFVNPFPLVYRVKTFFLSRSFNSAMPRLSAQDLLDCRCMDGRA